MKYYIEITDKKTDSYIFQSIWFDTEEEAIDFARKFDHMDIGLECWLMYSEWDSENDTYTDIKVLKEIKINETQNSEVENG